MKYDKHIKRRTVFVSLLMSLLGLGIIAQAAYTQMFESHIWNPENYNITRSVSVDASRGNIYSEDYSLLATSIPEYEIRWDATVANSSSFTENIVKLSHCLAELFQDKTALQYEKLLCNERRKKSRYVLIKRKASYNELKLLKTFPLFKDGRYKSGFIYHQKNKRQKPFKKLAARTIGYERIESKSVGLEGAYNLYLKGREGERLEQKLAGGVWMPIREIEPSPGKDLLTTIDIRYQDIAEQSLEDRLIYHNAQHGCAILMEVKTGAIKAIANLKQTEGKCVESYNYAIAESTEPGSTFKLASVIAGLEDGYLSLNDSVDTQNGIYKFYDKTMRDSRLGGYGKVSLKTAFEKSSNVGISKLINKHYKNKPEQFVDRLYNMGLHDPLGISISGESKPNIRHPKGEGYWSGTTIPWMSIGYGVELTPLQTLSFYATIANQGKRMRPYFVKAILDNGMLDKSFSPQVINPSICSNATIEIAREMLEGVVEQGTAKNIKDDQYRIAGKTGTNWIDYGHKKEDDRIKYQASFVGYFPAENPKYACIVVVNDPKKNGSYGGDVAAPIFKSISDYVFVTDLELKKENILDNLSLPHSKDGNQKDLLAILNSLDLPVFSNNNSAEWVLSDIKKDNIELKGRKIKDDLNGNIMPNIIGMGLRDALFLLENYGFKVNYIGKGSVKRQSIPKGRSIRKGQNITLELI